MKFFVGKIGCKFEWQLHWITFTLYFHYYFIFYILYIWNIFNINVYIFSVIYFVISNSITIFATSNKQHRHASVIHIKPIYGWIVPRKYKLFIKGHRPFKLFFYIQNLLVWHRTVPILYQNVKQATKWLKHNKSAKANIRWLVFKKK